MIFISFMSKDVECFFVYSFTICTSVENFLCNSFVHLLIGLLVLLVVNFLNSSYILDNSLERFFPILQVVSLLS
jgi:hypothetical protein